MQDFDWVALTVVSWLVLIVGPPAARVARRRTGAGSKAWKAAVFCAIATLFVVVLAGQLGVSFLRGWANLLSLLSAYLSYCILYQCIFLAGSKIVRVALATLLAIPMAFGYLLGTLGFLALIWIVGDIARPPALELAVAPELTCTVAYWGSVIEGGTRSSLYAPLRFAPFLRREVSWISDNQTKQTVSRSSGITHPEPVHERDFCDQMLDDYRQHR